MEDLFIVELTEEDAASAYPVVKQLRDHLDEESYFELVKEAMANEGYRMFGLVNGDLLVSVIGLMPMTTLYDGRAIWVSDLVTAEMQRSKGYGGILLEFAEEWAKDHGYGKITLSSGLQREDAHRFYEEKMNYSKKSCVFKKTL